MNKHPDELLRLIAKLYYVDGLDQSEVAEIAGLSYPGVTDTHVCGPRE